MATPYLIKAEDRVAPLYGEQLALRKALALVQSGAVSIPALINGKGLAQGDEEPLIYINYIRVSQGIGLGERTDRRVVLCGQV